MKPKTGAHHFSGKLDYDLQGCTAIVAPKKAGSDILRIAEVWGLAYYNWLIKEKEKSVDRIVFNLRNISPNKFKLESFVRRISYLKINQDFSIDIKYKKNIKLYTKSELEKRPKDEIVIKEFKQRTGKNVPGKLEKDFQSFIYGESIINQQKNQQVNYSLIYRRLGVLGVDFYNLKRNYKIIREFPAGVFNKIHNNKHRVLPTYFIDIMAYNKFNELSIIELKLNDNRLQVISQLIDYALFAIAYKKQIIEVFDNHHNKDARPVDVLTKPVSCYIANNNYHRRFDDIINYYSPEDKGFNFKLKKVTIGETKTV